MSEESNTNGAAGQPNPPQLVLHKIYVKDASFEAPNAPQIFNEETHRSSTRKPRRSCS